jgi:hypothetical protein
MKRLLKVILGFTVLYYLGFSFVFMSMNPFEWHWIGRLLFISLIMSFSVWVIDSKDT